MGISMEQGGSSTETVILDIFCKRRSTLRPYKSHFLHMSQQRMFELAFSEHSLRVFVICGKMESMSNQGAKP